MPAVKLYIADVGVLADRAIFDVLYRTVSEERRAKIDRLRRKEDKCLSLGAAVLLQKVLALNGITRATIAVDDNGKPFLPDYPDVFFNLSHSGRRVMCVVADTPVGCDVQYINESIDLSIAKRYFTSAETALITEAGDTLSQAKEFFRLWTIKESVVKQSGKGISALRAVDTQNLPAALSLHVIDRGDGYMMAACATAATFDDAVDVSLAPCDNMNRLQTAVMLLCEQAYTCVATNGERVLTDRRRGVMPLLDWLDNEKTLKGYVAADKVVGKGAAFLYIALHIRSLYARVISEPALRLLEEHGVAVIYDTLVPVIRNRAGDGYCPIETAVMTVSSVEEAIMTIRRVLS